MISDSTLDRRTTGRWRGVVAISLFAGAVGLLTTRPTVLFLAVLGVGLAVYPRVTSPGPVPELEIERDLSTAEPALEEPVDVTLIVRNVGDRTLPDLRLVDGVPPQVPVVEGSPRVGTALRPGAETRLTYTVEPPQGRHWFEPVTILSRDVSGGTEQRIESGPATIIDCASTVPTAPLRSVTRSRPGPIDVEGSGSGVEFSRTREYRAGDPVSHVDWNRFARSGELSTIEYRTQEAATVVICLDTRSVDSSRSPALSRCLAAADRFVDALADDRHQVGLAILGDPAYWLPPGTGSANMDGLRRVLRRHPMTLARQSSPSPDAVTGGSSSAPRTPGGTASSVGTDGGSTADGRHGSNPGSISDGGSGDPRLENVEPSRANDPIAPIRERLPPGSQVQLQTPLADEQIVRAILDLEATGHSVVVVSPDAIDRDTVGGRLAALERDTYIRTLRGNGIPVIDWGAAESLGTAVATELERST